MKRFGVFVLMIALFSSGQASWYWPFGSDDAVDERPRRVSELVEPASLLIEEAADLAAEGKSDEAIEKYRAALGELDRIELENPDRVKSAEFATIRNKRAYVNAAIDSMLLNQVKSNAKMVAVSDTTELERRLDRERWETRMNKVRETLSRKDQRPLMDKDVAVALVELEGARQGTTNAVLIAITHDFEAMALCQRGSFDDACRALVRSQQVLRKAGVLSNEDRQMVSNVLAGVWSRVVGGHRKTLADGRRVCAVCSGISTTNNLTSQIVVAAKKDCIGRLRVMQDPLALLAFGEARRLDRSRSDLLKQMTKDDVNSQKPTWCVSHADFVSSLKAFDSVSPAVARVEKCIFAVWKSVGGEAEKVKEKEKPGKEEKAKEVKQVKASSATCMSKREQAQAAVSKGDFKTAERLVGEMLAEKPNGAAALNLKAAMEARQGKFKEAEATLDQAIMSNPRNYFAYYNMANLMLQVRKDDKSVARRYYETGRVFGGPADVQLEEALK